MAVVSVPRALHDRLGGEAAESLVEMLRQLEDGQEQRRAEQQDHLLGVLDERFLRHLAETEERLHKEIGDVRANLGREIADTCANLGKEIADTRADLGKEIADLGKEIADTRADLHKEIGAVRKEITSQTKWILVVMVAATVLIPVWLRVMSVLIP